MKAQTDTNSHYSIENTKSQSALPTTLAKYLRILGTLALLGSGILYMFQGLDNIDMNMRNWVYLALISCLGAGGIFSFKLTQDRKGARLFFGLAAILVPVQFSQLGGIIYSYLGGGSGSLNSIFQFSETSISAIVVLTAISFIISAIIIYLAFYILARGQEKLLAILYLLVNVAILIPLREFPLGLLTLALLAIAVISIEKNIFNKSPVFKTLEGFSIRVMFTFPLLIAFIRSG